MKYLLDTNVISEATRMVPDARVVTWLGQNLRFSAVDPIILGELHSGICALPNGQKRRRLESWFESLASQIECIPWDREVGLRWGLLIAELQRKGNRIPVYDSMIAATALVHELTIVTRNVRDFERAGVPVFNPFE